VLIALKIIAKVNYMFGTKKIPLFVYSGPAPSATSTFVPSELKTDFVRQPVSKARDDNDDDKENQKPLLLNSTSQQHKHELTLPLKKRRALCELNGHQQQQQNEPSNDNVTRTMPATITVLYKPTPTYATATVPPPPPAQFIHHTIAASPSQQQQHHLNELLFTASSLFHMSPITPSSRNMFDNKFTTPMLTSQRTAMTHEFLSEGLAGNPLMSRILLNRLPPTPKSKNATRTPFSVANLLKLSPPKHTV